MCARGSADRDSIRFILFGVLRFIHPNYECQSLTHAYCDLFHEVSRVLSV